MRPHLFVLLCPCLAVGLALASRNHPLPVPLASAPLRSAAASSVPRQYDVLVYGGSFSGFAAVRTLKRYAPGARVLWVVPQDRLGEIGTVGGQCFWDMFQGRSYYYGGTFRSLFTRFG